MRAGLRIAVLAAAAAVGAYLLLVRQETPVARAAPAQGSSPDYFPFVRSMAGTRPDGAARAGADGQLQVNAELAYLFDYYLAGLGERPLEAIKAEIIRELDRRLPAAAAVQARRLLDNWLAYKRALVDVERGLPTQADPALRARQRLASMQQLRGAYFTPDEINGLFGASNAYDMDAIARLEINSDASLSDAQRKQKLAALDAALPPSARSEREAPTRVLRLEEAVATARTQGADDNEIYRIRSAAISPAAAARLADLDREEADWQRRISTYQSQRRQLQQSAANDASLQQLRDSTFSTEEQKRLPAYE
ncbi:Lipase chaperone LimK [Duganella sp. CF402]|uniref:lipase secretion chaperone n=1 Tax=unclassified Duganella TaxID=2636909 RepID=UPI0008AE763F|nr:MULTISPECIES: lipase secretion chaperone [unclassified Duganella]RZT10741.1 lipase chaperone LimK [Duganella sp. BK701]SEK99050.1 Lipase chaperone LimK [Duganella sp. CF402]